MQTVRKTSPGRPVDIELERRLYDSTFQLLAEVGYRQMSIDAIASRAGASRQTIYRKFGGIDDLIVAAAEYFYRDVSETPERTDDIYQDILNYLSGTVAILTNTHFGSAIRMVIPELQRNAQFAGIANKIGPKRRTTLRALLIDARKSGIVGAGIDIEALMDGITGAIYFRFFIAGRKLDRRYLKKLFDGLRAGSAVDPSDG